MKSKTDLINEIENIKEFEFRPIAIERDNQFFINKNLKAIVIVGENEIISTVSNKYKLIQFRDVFLPIVKNIKDCDGEIHTYKGKAILYLFPKGLEYITLDNHRIGLLLKNSVDKSSAVEIRFCVLINNYVVIIPKKIKQFRKIHTGKVLEFTQDFILGIKNITDVWKTIIQKYKDFAIDDDIKQMIYKELKLTKRVRKRLDCKKINNLWELFISVLNEITCKNYKSEIHKNMKIEKICNIFYSFAIGINI